MPTKVDAFKCDFCGRLLKTPHTAAWHEAACNKNPARRHCSTCVYGIFVNEKPLEQPLTVESYFTQSAPELYSGPYCAYHEKPMSEKPYFIECETNGGLDTGFGWIPETPVPFTCCEYKTKGYSEWTSEEEYKKNGGEPNGHQV